MPAELYSEATMNKNYGEILNFQESKSIDLPDFTITFLGETKREKEGFVNGFFVYFDYEIKKGADSMIVSWTPGTGFVSPGNFDFGGQKWVLDIQPGNGIAVLPFDQFEGHSVALPVNKLY